MGDKLRGGLLRVTSNTELMLGKLQSFESQLESMEEELKPLQESTGNYMMAKERINKTLVEMGKTHELYQVPMAVKGTVYQGYTPRRSTEFFAAIDKLTKSKEFFEGNLEMRSADSLLAQIKQLLSILEASCVKEIASIYENLGQSVIYESGKYKAVDIIDDLMLEGIHPLVQILVKIKSDEHTLTYKKKRATMMAHQAANFHRLKRDNWNALSNPPSSDGFRIRIFHSENSGSGSDSVFHQYLHFGLELLRGEVFFWSAILSQTGPGSIDVFVELCMEFVRSLKKIVSPYLSSDVDDGNKQGRSHHDNCLIRLELASSFMEYFENLYEVCKPDFRKDSAASVALLDLRTAVYTSAITGLQYLVAASNDPGPALSPEEPPYSSLTGEMKVTRATGAGTDVAAATALFGPTNAGEVCDLQVVVTQTLHCCQQLMRADDIVANLIQMCWGSHAQVPMHIPPSVRSVPTLVMTLLQNQVRSIMQKGEFIAAAVSAMASRSLQSKQSSTFSRDTFLGGAKVPMATRGSIADSLRERGSLFNPNVHLDNATNTHLLFSQLESGSEETVIAMMEACQYLFLANNWFRMHNFVVEAQEQLEACFRGKNNGSAGSSASGESKFLSTYFEEVRDSLANSKLMFCRTVATNMGMSATDEEDFNTRYAATPSSDKQSRGRLVKGKFALFNRGIEALLSQQGAWKVSAPSLRDELGLSLADAVFPYYSAFFDEYGGTNFSKRHMDQYVKFKPEEVRTLLLRFFGGNI